MQKFVSFPEEQNFQTHPFSIDSPLKYTNKLEYSHQAYQSSNNDYRAKELPFVNTKQNNLGGDQSGKSPELEHSMHHMETRLICEPF